MPESSDIKNLLSMLRDEMARMESRLSGRLDALSRRVDTIAARLPPAAEDSASEADPALSDLHLAPSRTPVKFSVPKGSSTPLTEQRRPVTSEDEEASRAERRRSLSKKFAEDKKKLEEQYQEYFERMTKTAGTLPTTMTTREEAMRIEKEEQERAARAKKHEAMMKMLFQPSEGGGEASEGPDAPKSSLFGGVDEKGSPGPGGIFATATISTSLFAGTEDDFVKETRADPVAASPLFSAAAAPGRDRAPSKGLLELWGDDPPERSSLFGSVDRAPHGSIPSELLGTNEESCTASAGPTAATPPAPPSPQPESDSSDDEENEPAAVNKPKERMEDIEL